MAQLVSTKVIVEKSSVCFRRDWCNTQLLYALTKNFFNNMP